MTGLNSLGNYILNKKKNQLTQGLMIALSGANGNVLGSYKDIKEGNFITLITNEELLSHFQAIHPMLAEKQVVDSVGRYSRKDVVDTNIIY